MADPRFDEIEGEEVIAPSFDAIEAEEEESPSQDVTPPEAARPRQRVYNTLRDIAEASGTVPVGIIPDEATARGAVASVLQGPAMQWADEVAGLVGESDAAVKYLMEGGQKPNLEQKYRDARERFRDVEGSFRAEHPAAAFALTAGSGAGLGGPIQSGAKGVARYIPSLVEGAVGGAGAAEESEDMGLGAAVGAPLGVGGQAFGEAVGSVAGEGVRRLGQSRLFSGLVKPSPAAQYLRSKHAGNLTIGQIAPDSALAQLEEAATSTAGMGPAVQGQRQAGQQAWQQAVMREALPPGQTEAIGDELGEQAASIFGGFEAAYAPAKGLPVDPRAVQSVLGVLDDPSIYATDATRSQVGKFIQDQLTALGRRSDGAVDSGDVINLRSFIRQQVRDLPDEARQERALFQSAVDSLTDTLDSHLPEDASTALRAADMQYAKAKTVADALARAKDQPTGFSTKQLSTSVAQNTPTPIYQQGGGGELRKLARAGEQTIGARIPVTGARLLSAGPVPYLTAPLAYAMNLPGPKAALLGGTGLQRSIVRGAAGAGAATGEAVARLGPAAAMASRGVAEAERPRLSTTAALVEQMATETPEALGPYAQQLQQAAADGTLPLVHFMLQQRDPRYRMLLEQARTGETQ